MLPSKGMQKVVLPLQIEIFLWLLQFVQSCHHSHSEVKDCKGNRPFMRANKAQIFVSQKNWQSREAKKKTYFFSLNRWEGSKDDEFSNNLHWSSYFLQQSNCEKFRLCLISQLSGVAFVQVKKWIFSWLRNFSNGSLNIAKPSNLI